MVEIEPNDKVSVGCLTNGIVLYLLKWNTIIVYRKWFERYDYWVPKITL